MKNENEKIHLSKASFKDWLEKLQQESWQLELLISGFALFAIWEARVLVDSYQNYLTINRNGFNGIAGIMSGAFSWLINIGWRIFFFNLLIHVLARGLWIGTIGLRYVSNDIDYDYFNYADNFTNYLKKNVGNFDDYIERLERFSSVIFAYTFLLFFIFLSLNLYFIETFAIINYINNPGIGGIFIIIFLFLGLIAFIDFITMGGIKKIKEKNIAKVYFVFYWIFSVLTLSFLYRPLLYNFWDEKYTRRLFLISLPYIFLLTFIPKIDFYSYPYFPNYHSNNESEKFIYEHHYYDDERILAQERKRSIFRGKHAIIGVSLPSIELSGNYNRFFIRSYPSDAKWIKKNKKITPYHEEGLVIQGWNNQKKNSFLSNLDSLESAQKVVLLNERFSLRKKINAKEITAVQAGIIDNNGKLEIDEQFWKEKEDSIKQIWWDKKMNYNIDRVKKLNNSLLELTTIKIDGIDFKDSCDCKMYIHPNMGEKGLRCYFPMKSLKEGAHLLHVNRKFFSEKKNSEMEEYYRDYYIPFYKIIKDY
jgi:hypothetical protein